MSESFSRAHLRSNHRYIFDGAPLVDVGDGSSKSLGLSSRVKSVY